MAAQRVLVAGADSYVGRYLCYALHEAGMVVRALVPDSRRALQEGLYGAPALADCVSELVTGHPARGQSADSWTADCEVVVSALGARRDTAGPRAVDVTANQRLLRSAERSGVRAVAYVAALTTPASQSQRLIAQQDFAEELSRSSLIHQVFRHSVLFSDLTELIMMARTGVTVQVGDGQALLNPIHGADLAAAIVPLLGERSGEWEFGGPRTVSQAELARLAAAAWGTRARHLRVGPRLLAVGSKAPGLFGARRRSALELYAEIGEYDLLGEPQGSMDLEEYAASLVAASPRIIRS